MGSFLGSKNGLGTKHAPRGAPRGATTKIPSPLGAQVGPQVGVKLGNFNEKGVSKHAWKTSCFQASFFKEIWFPRGLPRHEKTSKTTVLLFVFRFST